MREKEEAHQDLTEEFVAYKLRAASVLEEREGSVERVDALEEENAGLRQAMVDERKRAVALEGKVAAAAAGRGEKAKVGELETVVMELRKAAAADAAASKPVGLPGRQYVAGSTLSTALSKYARTAWPKGANPRERRKNAGPVKFAPARRGFMC